jgi:hypothetical protein
VKEIDSEQFDPTEAIAKFEEENAPIEIPPEVENFVDNDIELSEEDLSKGADD